MNFEPKCTFRKQLFEFFCASLIFNVKYEPSKNINKTKIDLLQIFRSGKSENITQDVLHMFHCLRYMHLPQGNVKIMELSKPISLSKLIGDQLTIAFDEITHPSFRFKNENLNFTLKEMNKVDIDWNSVAKLFPILSKRDSVLFVNVLRLYASQSETTLIL
jgi:hypothetical protein